ncbi:hypothetical protein MPSEU_000136100 [Mayamaea pseudoterrestris]|nr:hypothetical protein MPSEU_000136100 [Mayamaea pseudoterrestris]
MTRPMLRIALLLSVLIMSSGQAARDRHELQEIVRQLVSEHAGTINSKGDATKHTPIVHIAYDRARVTIPHEMNPTKPHWIQYVWAVNMDDNRILGVSAFDASDRTARLSAEVRAGTTIRAYAYCNEHGLWASKPMKVPIATATGDGDANDEL